MYAAIDGLLDKLVAQAKKYKSKQNDHGHSIPKKEITTNNQKDNHDNKLQDEIQYDNQVETQDETQDQTEKLTSK